jgi:hypothetical protein
MFNELSGKTEMAKSRQNGNDKIQEILRESRERVRERSLNGN